MFKKANKRLLICCVLVTLFLMLSGFPRGAPNEKISFKNIPKFPRNLEKINSVPAYKNQSLVIPVPRGYSDYQIFVGKKLENLNLKAKVATEFSKYAGQLLSELQTNESKIFTDIRHQKNKQQAVFILKNTGELYYQKNKNTELRFMAEYSPGYFDDIRYMKVLSRQYQNIAEISDDHNNLIVYPEELDKLALNSETLTIVFYKKSKKKNQKRFKSAFSEATEITISAEQTDRGNNNQTAVPDADKNTLYDQKDGSLTKGNQSKIISRVSISGESSSVNSDSSSSSSSCDAYGAGSGNEGDSAIVSIFGDGNSQIESVLISNEKPKENDWKNARNDLGEFNWKYKISEDGQSAEAIADGYRWFGVGDEDDSCIEPIVPGNRAGVYKADLTVDYENGCQVNTEIEIDINYPSIKGFTAYDIKENLNALTYQIKSGYPKKSFLLWECCVDPVCEGNECLKAESYVTQQHDAGMQYKSLVDQEEQFHVSQNLGAKDWSQGGNSQNGIKAFNFNQFADKYALKNTCATGLNETYACQNAYIKSKTKFKKAFSKYRKDYIKWTAKTRCYRELTAKNGVGFTQDKAGMDYYCAYMRNGGCAEDGGEKRYLWEFIGR